MDNLENLYRKSFEDFERKPKAGFWDKLAPIIPPKPSNDKSKFGLFIAYCAGLLSMLLLVLGYQFFIEKESNHFISSLPIELKNEHYTTKTDLLDFPKVNKSSSTKNFNIDNNKELTSMQDENIATTATPQTIPFAKPNALIATRKELQKEAPSHMTAQQDFIGKNSSGIDNETASVYNKRTKKITTIKPEKRLGELLLLPLLTKNYLTLNVERTLFYKKKRRLGKRNKELSDGIEYAFVGAQYTPSSLGLIKIDDHINGTTFSQNAGIDRTKGYDVYVGFQLKSNWFMQTGFTNHTYALQQTHRQSIITNYTNSVTLEEGIVQDYSFAGQPIVEPIQEKIEVWSKENELQDGAPFLVQSTTQQRLKLLSVYSQIGYRFRLSPRWQLIPKLGVGVMWGEKGKVELANIDLLDMRQNLVSAAIANTNVTNFSLVEGLVSTELTYRFSRRISFTGAPQYRFGFKPFFNNYQRSAKHRFGQLQLGIRIHIY